MYKLLIVYLLCSMCFVGCGVPKDKVDKIKLDLKNKSDKVSDLQYEITKLEKKLEEAYSELLKFRTTPSRMLSQIRESISENDVDMATELSETLSTIHPDAPEAEEARGAIASLNKKIEVERAEEVRLANLNNTGMWKISAYVDSFGESTKNKYISNRKSIKGTFSNTAVTDENLNVDFLVSSKKNISIMLYEYAGRHPVKSYGDEGYNMVLRSADGMESKVTGNSNKSDRISFGSDSLDIHKHLLKGGKIRCRIFEQDQPVNSYSFTLDNSDFYDNAYRLLTGESGLVEQTDTTFIIGDDFNISGIRFRCIWNGKFFETEIFRGKSIRLKIIGKPILVYFLYNNDKVSSSAYFPTDLINTTVLLNSEDFQPSTSP